MPKQPVLRIVSFFGDKQNTKPEGYSGCGHRPGGCGQPPLLFPCIRAPWPGTGVGLFGGHLVSFVTNPTEDVPVGHWYPNSWLPLSLGPKTLLVVGPCTLSFLPSVSEVLSLGRTEVVNVINRRGTLDGPSE